MQLEKYPAHSIRRVEFYAHDDGRLAWARDPVRFCDANESGRMLTNWTNPQTGEDVFETAAITCGADKAAVNSLIDRIVGEPEKITPAHLRSTSEGRLGRN